VVKKSAFICVHLRLKKLALISEIRVKPLSPEFPPIKKSAFICVNLRSKNIRFQPFFPKNWLHKCHTAKRIHLNTYRKFFFIDKKLLNSK